MKKLLVKLTDQDGKTGVYTPNETQWGEGVTHTAQGDPDQGLCTDGWIHAYEGLGVALLMNPLGADIPNPIAWEAKGKIGKRDGWKKCGCRTLTTVRRLEYIRPPVGAYVTAAIYCAMAVYSDAGWLTWAEGWLSGKNRSLADAARVARAAEAAEAAGVVGAAEAAGAAGIAEVARDVEIAGAVWVAQAAWVADIIESALIWWTNPPIEEDAR
jgi:hypothetical protein